MHTWVRMQQGEEVKNTGGDFESQRNGIFERPSSLLRAGPPARAGHLWDRDFCRNRLSQHAHLCLWVNTLACSISTTCTPVLIVCLFPPLLIVMFWLCCMGKAKGQNVCLLGLSDSGKTLLYLRVKLAVLQCMRVLLSTCMFTQIISGNFMRTQNSIKENESQYERSDKVYTALDFAGCGILISCCDNRKESLLHWSMCLEMKEWERGYLQNTKTHSGKERFVAFIACCAF